MSKRKYTKMDKYSAQIVTMREEGRTRQETANTLGLDFDQEKTGSREIIRYEIHRRTCT